MRWKRMTIGVVVACLAIAPAAQAAQFTVTGTADVAGSCIGTECTSIRAALGAISSGDQITLQPGAYQLASALVLNTPVALRGDTARNTTITAASGARALLISANATISHLTVTDGTAPNDFGGNILAQSVTVGLDQVRITNGRAGTGGGIANRNGTMTITNSLIDGNSAAFTGGKGDPLEGAAGGIVNAGDALGPASLTLTNSTVSRNAAVRGGGIVSYGNAGNALALENVTVAGNFAGAGGSGGIFAQLGTFSLGSSILAGNTLIADGSTSNCGGDRASSQGWNVETGDECLTLGGTDHVNVADAGLATSPANHGGETDVLALGLGSPAVDVRTPPGCQLADQRGVARPQGAACDAGAVELDTTAPTVEITSAPSSPTNQTSIQLGFTSPETGVTFECTHTPPSGTPVTAGCTSPWTVDAPGDGDHTFAVVAVDAALNRSDPDTRTIRVDTVAPDPPAITSPDENAVLDSAFVLAGTTPSGTTTIHLFDNGTDIGTASVFTGSWSREFGDQAEGTYVFTATATDAAGNTSAPSGARTVRVDTVAPTVTINPPNPTNATSATITFAASEPGVTYTCRVTVPQPTGDPKPQPCTSPWTYPTPDEGEYLFEVSANDGRNPGPYARATVVVERAAPAAVAPSQQDPATFTFAGAENGGSFECRLEGPSGDSGFGPCTSPRAYPDLPAGDYRFTLRTLDAAGNHADAPAATFSIAATPTATAVPEPAPTPVVVPVATPSPTPQAGETVVARPSSGKIFVRQPGSTEFVEIERSSGVRLGSEIDARKGRVVLTSEPGDGKPVERATFYAGLFIVRQVGGYVELTLSEELAPCKKKKASAAAAKPKSRKLWGDGKGKFRTKGQYSAATIRGTKWLVEDSCDGTLTRVAQGVVSVRDTPKRKTVLLRAGRKYLAKPPKN